MPIKRKEEVCGKPNQYDPRTQQYDWRELPDTHISVPTPQPRVRDYSGLAGYGAAAGREVNPTAHEPLRSPRLRPIGGNAVSPTPLPSPSRPMQEEVRRISPPVNADNNRGLIADWKSAAQTPPHQRRSASPSVPPHELLSLVPYEPRLPAAVTPPFLNPSNFALGAVQAPGYYAAAPTPQQPLLPSINVFAIPWTHEDIKRVVYANHLEAQRCYLR